MAEDSTEKAHKSSLLEQAKKKPEINVEASDANGANGEEAVDRGDSK